jgi:hypothetical protein
MFVEWLFCTCFYCSCCYELAPLSSLLYKFFSILMLLCLKFALLIKSPHLRPLLTSFSFTVFPTLFLLLSNPLLSPAPTLAPEGKKQMDLASHHSCLFIDFISRYPIGGCNLKLRLAWLWRGELCNTLLLISFSRG